MRVSNIMVAIALLAITTGRPALAGTPLRDAVPVTTFGQVEAEPSFEFDPAMTGEGAPSGQQSWMPLLYSALIPGAGEISMGYYKRGIALVAAEIVAWTGYTVNHNEGLDKRDEYEAFADAHWDMDRWIQDHPCNVEQFGERNLENLELCGQSTSGSGLWPGYIPYISKDDDKQHYYENLGKYDWYISGWEDWGGYNPEILDYEMQTPLRDQYRTMRGESNDALDASNRFIWVSVAARAFSLVETAIIIHNRRENFDAGDGGMALRARPRGLHGGEVALEVSFR
jgi:hypothetical protein